MNNNINFADALGKMEEWLSWPEMPPKLFRELKSLEDRLVENSGDKEAKDEIFERFYKELDFGTGGLRGILGAGTNRMNIFTVRHVTQGFADYINKNYSKTENEPAVAIAYDSRNGSIRFALESAGVLIANGIRVYIYRELMPTPALSFAVRHFNCAGGIMITASHNPSNYNGYKVYNDEGCQVTDEAANEILGCIRKLSLFADVKVPSINIGDVDETNLLDDIEHEYLNVISSEAIDEYISAVKGTRVGIDCENLEVVFTPLNGAGNKTVRRILKEINVGKVHVVPEQEKPDGNFPTCPYPNPEKEEALLKGLTLCKALSTPDLLLATDPDCDRLGVAVRTQKEGKAEYIRLSGNEIGVLLLDFIAGNRKMPLNPVAMKTIVSTKMADALAADYGVEMKNLLTGFKYIGEQVGILERKGEENRFIFGFEESYGYLAGPYVRDKDAVNAAMLICEGAAYYKKQGKTLIDRMEELYNKYGWYLNELLEFTLEGATGMVRMNEILSELRKNPPKEIHGLKVVKSTDYKEGKNVTSLPQADVLEYVLCEGSSVIIRPSGTEPKLKVYISSKGADEQSSKQTIEGLMKKVKEWIE